MPFNCLSALGFSTWVARIPNTRGSILENEQAAPDERLDRSMPRLNGPVAKPRCCTTGYGTRT